MPDTAFSRIDTWVFDLDHTLYPHDAPHFAHIEARMSLWIMEKLRLPRAEADRLRHAYWLRYGTTLAGLMAEHGVDPGSYLGHVHDVPMEGLHPDPVLAARIAALPGRRIVFTNGTVPYAERVLAARGLSGVFDGVFGVEDAGFIPKPERAAFDSVFALAGVAAAGAAMFEDNDRNLVVPHALGLRTVHVAPVAVAGDHIHHHTDDLSAFLSHLGR